MSMILKFMATVVMMIAYNSGYYEGPELIHISIWIIYLMASSFREIEDKAKHQQYMKYINAIYQRQAMGRPMQPQQTRVVNKKGGFIKNAKRKIGLGPKGSL